MKLKQILTVVALLMGCAISAQAQVIPSGVTRYLVLKQTPVAAIGAPLVTATTVVTGTTWQTIPGMSTSIRVREPYRTFDVIGTLYVPLVLPFAFPDQANVPNRKLRWRFLLNDQVVGGDNIQSVVPFSLRNLKRGTYKFEAQFQSVDGTPVEIGGVDLTAVLNLRTR